MAPSSPPPVTHDGLFKELVSSRRRADVLLRERLPPEIVARLSDELPRLLDGSFTEGTRSDLLFQVALKGRDKAGGKGKDSGKDGGKGKDSGKAGEAAFVYVLLEHKSRPDWDTPLQLAGYMVSIWKRYAKEHEGRVKRLPPIVPLVLYHGKARWSVPRSLAEMVGGGEDLRRYARDFSYRLLDLADIPPGPFSGDAVLQYGLFLLYRASHGPRGEAFLEDVAGQGWPAEALATDPDLAGRMFRYTLDHSGLDAARLKEAKQTILTSKRGGDNMLTLSQQLYQEGVLDGEAKGEAKGKTEGEATGMVKILLRLLERRFGPLPPSVPSRVAKASADELDVWTDQVLDASSLEEMFGADAGVD